VTNGHRGTVQPSHSNSQDSGALARRKAEARARASARRERISAYANAGQILRDRVLAAIPLSKDGAVSAFWPMGSEIDTRPLMEALHRRGHAVGLPVTARRGMPLVFRTWKPGLGLIPGGFGTQVPGPEAPELRPEVLFVPLLAFDRAGYRLGYGGGFYDRTLAALRAEGAALAVGVGYAEQEIPEVPRDAHDQRLDWIVTEAEEIRID